MKGNNMSKFTDIRLQELLAEKLDIAFDESDKVCDDRSYTAYLWFSVLGAMLVEDLGPEKTTEIFNQMIAQTKS